MSESVIVSPPLPLVASFISLEFGGFLFGLQIWRVCCAFFHRKAFFNFYFRKFFNFFYEYKKKKIKWTIAPRFQSKFNFSHYTEIKLVQ